MMQSANSFDLFIDSVPNKHDLNPYLPLLDVDGTLVIVGAPQKLGTPAAPL